jgi:5S rRNA maturation endonuclease (ribonuclease M5)
VSVDDALELVLGKLDGVRQHGGYWMARCPAHEDTRASLSVGRGTEQPVVFKCHAGCDQNAILDALGLSAADVSKPREQQEKGEWTPQGEAVAIYDYVDENGTLLFQVCRTAKKDFPQRVPDASKKSGWRWSLGSTRRVPYRLPKVLAAIAENRTVYIVEGEKDVQAIERVGAVATTGPGGAGKWRDEYDEHFRGADVVIIADRDEPGRKHAIDVAAHLRAVTRSVRIAEAADGKDATDHLAAGHSLAELVPQKQPGIPVLAVIDLEPAAEFVPAPTLICQDMLYAGGVHTLTGPPDSGKTTLALWWMLQAVRAGGTVLFLDEEGGREIVVEKFQALGAKTGERIGYVPFPSRSWNAGDIAMLNDVLDERKPAIVAWDSSAAFLARAGLDENAAADVTRFYTHVLTPAARLHDASVLVIDHDTKSAEPSRYARGSGAKLAATDVAYKVMLVKPFSKTENGTSKLLVTKDRRGWLGRSHEVAFLIGAGDAVSLTVSITAARPDPQHPELAPAEQKVLDALDNFGRSITELMDRIAAVHGSSPRRPTVQKALSRLQQMGLAAQLGTAAHLAHLWKTANGP